MVVVSTIACMPTVHRGQVYILAYTSRNFHDVHNIHVIHVQYASKKLPINGPFNGAPVPHAPFY